MMIIVATEIVMDIMIETTEIMTGKIRTIKIIGIGNVTEITATGAVIVNHSLSLNLTDYNDKKDSSVESFFNVFSKQFKSRNTFLIKPRTNCTGFGIFN